MFRVRRFYKHKNCLDLIIEVIKVQYADARRIKLKIYYTDGKTRYHPNPQVIEIARSQVKNWLEVDVLDKV